MNGFAKTLAVAALVTGAMAVSAPAFAAEPIVGNWKTPKGTLVGIAPCGAGFCATVKSGTFKGRSIGSMSGKNGQYKGKLTDLEAKKTYRGKGWMSGKNLKMRGYSGIFFSTQTWVRQ